jgi:signal transduction histidine kinase
MAVLPGGRGNDFARKLGIGQDPVAACALLAAGRERRVDVAQADGRAYVGILSAGLDSDVQEIANATRLPLGTLVYLYGALRALRRLLYLIVGLAVALAAGLAWLYARAALRPLERVVEAAAAVRESGDLSRRVAHHGPSDEIGRLRDTFNSMLEELETAHARLDRSNARLRQFLADCSHELRAPLTLILSNLDLLSKMGATDRAFRERALADIRAEADRMARMVSQLLILARADAGAQPTSDPVQLRDVVADAGRHGHRMARDVHFVPDETGAVDNVVVLGNADYLRQVLLILLDNAFKYTPAPGEVRIETALEDDHARVTVSDTGSGIEPADLPRIFDRFHRGLNVDGVTGTGLGLAIAQLVAEQHGGRIDVESTTGEGSRFSLVLPLADATLGARHPTPHERDESRKGEPAGDPGRFRK